MTIVNARYTGPDDGLGTVKQDWLILQQEEIPQSQRICTVEDLRNMMALAMTGQAAKSYTSDNCPVKRRFQADKVIIVYEATILIHRSETLAGAYTLTASEGELSIGQTIQRPKKEQYDLNYESFKGLGWLPAVEPSYYWLTRVKNIDKIRVFTPEKPYQDNGYIYYKEAYKGTVQVSGSAIVDKYILSIEHQQGYNFDKTILVTAEYGNVDEQGRREAVQLEVKPPQCWIDEANKCPGSLFAEYGKIFSGEGEETWEMNYGPATWKLHIGACSGTILKKERG